MTEVKSGLVEAIKKLIKELPDISHLTPEEQQKILIVIQRQQDEEEKEKNMLKVLHDQFEDYKSHIKMVAEESKVTTPAEENDPVCALCCKTKFAEGCGHVCTFCEVRFCSRCGGRITIKSNKTMWVCNLCRKQKEMLTKSGAWYYGENNKLSISLKPLKESIGKENQNEISRNNSEQCTNNLETREKNHFNKSISPLSQSRTNVEMKMIENHDKPMDKPPNHEQDGGKIKKVETSQSFNPKPAPTYLPRVTTSSDSTLKELDNKILEFEEVSQLVAEKTNVNKQIQKVVATNEVISHKHSADNIHPDNSCDSKLYLQNSEQSVQRTAQALPMDQVHNSRICMQEQCVESVKQNSCVNFSKASNSSYRKTHLHGCQSEPNILGCCSKKDLMKDSSNPRKLISREKHRRRGREIFRDPSMSSSEDDIHSTTEYSSYDDADKETSISDNDYVYSKQPHRMYRDSYHHFDQYVDSLTKSSTSLCSCHRSTSNNRDSGVESGSVPCADISQQEQFPVSWQPSSDGSFLIGHLLLYKNISSTSYSARQAGALLGLKVVGGKSTPSGRLGAFITKVKKGSLADTIGHLKPGDEIVSWNKHCLQDASFDEVYEIILSSKQDIMVELVVSRPIKDVPRIPETRIHQTAESSSCSLDSERREFEQNNIKPLQGKIQIRIWYDDKTQQLYVTAICAVDLPLREGGLPRNPYLKMYLLPDRSNKFKRRTKTAKKTLSPEWLQTFVYGDVRRDDLGAMALELTLWDYDRSLEANNKFMGEVMIDLGLVCLDDEPHWFRLMPLGYGMNQDYVLENQSYHVKNTSSMSSENNFLDESNNNSKLDKMTRSKEEDSVRCSNFSNTLPKRRLPHIPTSVSQNSVVSEIMHSEIKSVESRSRSVEPQTETEVIDDLHSSKTSMEFDAVSVDRTLQTFVGGIGPGQIVGRQALALTCVGEIELGLYERRSQLQVQVIRARKLTCKPGAKVKPAHYVKVYMMLGMQCTAKRKTKIASRSLNPSFHQPLVFNSSQPGNALQIIVWGDYGRMDNKVFVGMAQIALDDLDLSTHVIGWYKLFPTSSIIDASTYGPRKESYSSFGSSLQTIA